MSRQVLHNYPRRMADYDWPFEDKEGGRTVHDQTDPENCWCCPVVMEWQEHAEIADGKPVIRRGWVVVIEGKTPEQLIRESKPQEE